MAQLLRKFKRAVFNYDPSFCDMYEDESSRRVAEEYLGPIREHLHKRFGSQRLTILDAGCQAGRLLIPLAQAGHHVIGIDTSGFALRRARQHAQERHLSVQFRKGNMAHLRRWIQPGSLHAVICAEVLYLCHDYPRLLDLLAESLKPDGLLCVSHRPSVYYLAAALRRGHPEQAASLIHRTEGPSPDGAYHNWQTPQQLTDLYRAHQLNLLACYPVNHATVSLDGSLINGEAQRLLETTRQPDSTFRIPSYWFVVAEKTSGTLTRDATAIYHA